jgi:uncharacterized Zn finger protein (UPF0148 family)
MENLMGKDVDWLERTGHQPCRYIDHIQGTNIDEYECPVCKEVYTSSNGRAFCFHCYESKSDAEARIKKYQEEAESHKKSAEELLRRSALIQESLETKRRV